MSSSKSVTFSTKTACMGDTGLENAFKTIYGFDALHKESMHAISLLLLYGLPSPRHYYQSMWHAGDKQCSQLKRIGNLGDGGKFVCMDALQDPIRVLSVGSQGDFTFENDILRHFPRAIITTMDGTVSSSVAARAPPNVSFVRSNFDSSTQVVNQLDILKIDCEGCELHALMPFLSRTCVFQILLETHACMQPLQRHHALMTKLNHSFGVFVKEPNIEFSDGTCVEFGLLRRRPCKSRLH